MGISSYELSVESLRHMLANLRNIVAKAAAYAEDADIDPDALLQARLYPDMGTFAFQIRVATDVAKGCVARLAGREPPVWADDEVSFADLDARLGRALEFLDGFSPDELEGAEERHIALKLRDGTHEMSGRDYLLRFALPNVHFHVAIAYALMRHNGLALAKRDFIGAFTPER